MLCTPRGSLRLAPSCRPCRIPWVYSVALHFLTSPYAEPDRFRVRALDLQVRIMRNLARRHVQQICPAQTVGHQAVPHATYPMGDPTPYKRALSGQPDEPCFPYQVRGGHRGGAAGMPWRLRHSCHPTRLVS